MPSGGEALDRPDEELDALGGKEVGNMTVAAHMTENVVSVEPSCQVEDVLERMLAYRISCVIVCEGNAPVGIITEWDVIGLAANRLLEIKDPRKTAADLMTAPVKTIQGADSIAKAIEYVRVGKIRHLPVVDADGGLIGLLTQTNLLQVAEENVTWPTE